MNYKKNYYKIIKYAQEDLTNRINGYYERHHIIPKSLNGLDTKLNLVKLTAREHFICHWLLVKMFNKGTIERKKMLCAFWFMRGSPSNDNKRYINSRAYEKIRKEFIEIQSKFSKLLINEKNGMYNLHWFTNSLTGESKPFIEKPNDYWFKGKNLFNNSFCKLTDKPKTKEEKRKAISDGLKSYYSNPDNIIKHRKSYTISNHKKKYKKIKCYNNDDMSIYYFNSNEIPKNYSITKTEIKIKKTKLETEKYWNLFNNSDCSSINTFCKKY